MAPVAARSRAPARPARPTATTRPAKARTRAIRGFADFVTACREAVEAEAARNADDRFWILDPSLVSPPALRPLSERELRALVRGGVRGLLEAVDEHRCGVSLHVDLAVDDVLFSAIVLSVAGTMATSTQYARIERDAAGLPSLGPWTTAPELEDELVAAAASAL